jgi:hypothetical protein
MAVEDIEVILLTAETSKHPQTVKRKDNNESDT